MIYRGHVFQGRVVFDEPADLPDGVPVQVHVIESGKEISPATEPPSLYERLQDLIGQAQDLPADAAEQVDHYLYGTPKRP
jgi:hypothetical protein